MAIHLKNQDEVKAEINMTPLIDIMLVLLIIFMVTSSVSLESGLDINIPKSISKITRQQSNSVTLSLDARGLYAVQGVRIRFNELELALQAALEKAKHKTIVFEADKTVDLGKTVEIMDLAKRLGATKFAIAAEQN